MKSETPLDCAVFQLSPKRSRCELFVLSDGNTEKLASGLVKPFVAHLKVAREQFGLAVQSIKLDADRHTNAEMWFTKGTLERFVRFVSTPEVLELVNTFDAEMSQLEAALQIYSQGVGDQISNSSGGSGTGDIAAADATKKELLRAIDIRLVTVRQDLVTACTRAAAADFNPATVSQLQIFADQFGAHRLSEACGKFISLCERRPELINQWRASADNRAVRSSYGSDMSIDEDTPTPDHSPAQTHLGSHLPLSYKQPTGPEPDATQQQEDPSKASTCHQSNSTYQLRLRRRTELSVEKDEVVAAVAKDKKAEDSFISDNSDTSQQTGPPARRLSVQDRINLFESKQKESSGGSGGKPIIVGKSAELRRLSSDVSSALAAAEKAVLRRWSGVSDMSIDLSGEKKETDSPLCTPSSSTISPAKSEERKGLSDTASSPKPEFRSVPGIHLTGSSRSEEASESNIKIVETDQTCGKTQSRSSLDRAEDNSLKDQSQTQFGSLPVGNSKQLDLTDQGKLEDSATSEEQDGIREQVFLETQIPGPTEKAAPQNTFRAFVKKGGDDRFARETVQHTEYEPQDGVDDVGLSGQSASQSRFRAASKGLADSWAGSRIEESFLSAYKGTENDSLDSQPRGRSLGEIEEVGNKELVSLDEQFGSGVIPLEDPGRQRMKFEKVSPPEPVKKSQGRRDDSSRKQVTGKMKSDTQEVFSSISSSFSEQVQRARQSRGNQELNDELKMKANELEKLFAEHRLLGPGYQPNSARRSKAVDMQVEPLANLPYMKAVTDSAPAPLPDKSKFSEASLSSTNETGFDSDTPMKGVDTQNAINSLDQNFSELGFSDDSRGKFYERYMQKRDAKLREESGRAEKEAKLKAMHDSLERSKAELQARFSGSADRQDSAFGARRRAERLASFNIKSNIKREQFPLDFMQSEDDEDLSEFPEQRKVGETSLDETISRTTQSRKLNNKNLSSSTLRTPKGPISRPAVKVANSSLGRGRMQSENSLAQSVSNFSDLRKENTKPSFSASKTARPQLRNYARSKSSTEALQEEKPRLSRSLRKSSASPAEFRDTSLNSDGVILTPLKFRKEWTDQSPHDNYLKTVESKSFLRKGNGMGLGAGVGIPKLKALAVSDTVNKEEEESDELVFEEDSGDMFKDEEEEFETARTEPHATRNNREAGLNEESEKLMNSGSEIGDALQYFTQDPYLVSDLPVAVRPSNYRSGFVQDSPGESPVSWNSRIHNLFSFPNDASDVDAFADSPVGSSASWNSHNLNQTEDVAARMRKKWESAQKPVLVAPSSHNQSRKDVTKGFKRLLKFGRKSHGTESLVDGISATTSEGDDDAEDGQDPANRSSEDLRKSTMGFLQGRPSNDSLNESQFFGEQVQALQNSIPAPPAKFKLREDHLSGSSTKGPRSFFSLSSFRSKRNDSKPR